MRQPPVGCGVISTSGMTDCSTVRSKVARADGLTEERVQDLLHDGTLLSPRERAALEYADLFKSGDEAIDSDAVYARLRGHFTEEEIIELGMLCAQTVGVGRLVRSLNILSWEEACDLDPRLREKLEPADRVQH